MARFDSEFLLGVERELRESDLLDTDRFALARKRLLTPIATATWVGDTDILPEGVEVDVLLVDAPSPNEVPARAACWVRWKPEDSQYHRYRSCDLCDLEFVAKNVSCTCLSELEDDGYGPGGPMSGHPKPPPCQLHQLNP